jgi:hypothetical protein
VYVHILCGSHNIQWTFPWTSLNQLVFIIEKYSILCDVGIEVSHIKGKGTPRNRPEGPEGGRGTALIFLDLGTRRGNVVSTTPRPLYPGKEPVPTYRRLSGPHGRSGRVRKISPPPGFDPRTVQPVAIPTELPRSPEVLHTSIIPINIRSVKIVLNNQYIELSSQLMEIPEFEFEDQSVTKSNFLCCVNWTQRRDTLCGQNAETHCVGRMQRLCVLSRCVIKCCSSTRVLCDGY